MLVKTDITIVATTLPINKPMKNFPEVQNKILISRTLKKNKATILLLRQMSQLRFENNIKMNFHGFCFYIVVNELTGSLHRNEI